MIALKNCTAAPNSPPPTITAAGRGFRNQGDAASAQGNRMPSKKIIVARTLSRAFCLSPRDARAAELLGRVMPRSAPVGSGRVQLWAA